MDRRNKNKTLFYTISGSFLASTLGLGIYKFYKNFVRDRLNSQLENYISEVHEKIKLENKLSVEIMANIFNLITEIEEYLYNKDYSHIEEIRLKLLNTKDYENAVNQTIEFHEISMNKANRIIEKRLNISINDLRDAFESHSDKTQLKNLLESTRKNLNQNELPKFEKENVRKAFILYANQLIQQDKVNVNNFNLTKMRPEFKEMTLHIYYLNKYIAKDTIKSQFGIDEKHFRDLLKLHKLEEDSELKLVLEQMRQI